MHELYLEALTQQPEEEIRALLEFCDLGPRYMPLTKS